MENYLTFSDVAQRMKDAKFQTLPYWNRRGVEGVSIGFFHFTEWFEVNVHDAAALSLGEVLRLLQASPDTQLNNPDDDKYGNRRWFGGAWVGKHHVRVWFNPQAF
jgi:hypothetical protein